MTAASPLRHKAILWLILATAAWGLSFPLMKMLFAIQSERLPGAPSAFFSAHIVVLRSLCAGLILLALRPHLLVGLTRGEWLQGALLGVFGGAGLLFQAEGLHDTSASVSAFLTQFYCAILPFVYCLRQRTWPSWVVAVSTLMVLAGIAILSQLRWSDWHLGRGELFTLVSALFFTVQILLLERPQWQHHRMIPVTAIMFAGFICCNLPVVLSQAPSASALFQVYGLGPELGIVAVIILLCTVLAYTCMNRWQPHVSAVEGGLIYCLEPVCTALYVLFLPGLLAAWCGVPYANEVLTLSTIIGGLLITGANILLHCRRS